MTHDRPDGPVPPTSDPTGPGLGQAPLAPAFRDGPRRAPQRVGTLLLQGVPFLVLVGVVLWVASR